MNSIECIAHYRMAADLCYFTLLRDSREEHTVYDKLLEVECKTRVALTYTYYKRYTVYSRYNTSGRPKIVSYTANLLYHIFVPIRKEPV